jgi:hypothetical protein
LAGAVPSMRALPQALLAAPLLLLAFVPTAAADVDVPDPTQVGPVDCLLQPQLPETFVYYIIWGCATGGVAPEPVQYATGCTVEFPLQLECSQWGTVGRLSRIPGCVRDDDANVGCFLGVEPDPVACLVNQIRNGLPCR